MNLDKLINIIINYKMEAPKYILDIIACLDDEADNLEQIIDGFQCELEEDGKLYAF